MDSMAAIVRTQLPVSGSKKAAFGRVEPTTMRRTVKGKAGSGPNFKLDQPEKLWEIGSSSCMPLRDRPEFHFTLTYSLLSSAPVR